MDFNERVFALSRQGFMCSQILMTLALDLEGKENTDLIRAMSGLTMGMGGTGGTCGILTGGAAVLGYFTGQGEAGELPHAQAAEIIAAYVDWFHGAYGRDFCRELLGGDFARSRTQCPPMLEAAYEKILELLEAYAVIER